MISQDHEAGSQTQAVVLGYLDSTLGVGESARALAAALRAAGVATREVAVADPWAPFSKTAWCDIESARPLVRFLCFNANETPLIVHHPTVRRISAQRTVGVWHWELESFPEHMHVADGYVDEIWAGSTFTKQAIARNSLRPVHAMPPGLSPKAARGVLHRDNLGLSDGFLFLCSFDYRSVFERKNPLAVVAAFRKAFAPNEGPILLLKTTNETLFPRDRRRLGDAVGMRNDIIILDRNLSREENDSLTNMCDSYVSLHRAEGFGLSVAEAAMRNKPIVATGYSGPLDFLEPDSSMLVPYQLVPVGPGLFPYPRDATWAEPDVASAAKAMRWLWEHPEKARGMGAAAGAIMQRHTVAARSTDVLERWKSITTTLAQRPRPAAAPLPAGISIAERAVWKGRTVAYRNKRRYDSLKGRVGSRPGDHEMSGQETC